MIEASYEELQRRGFEPTRLGANEQGLPMYMLGNLGERTVMVKNLRGDKYYVHLYADEKDMGLTDTDIECNETLSDISTLEELAALA